MYLLIAKIFPSYISIHQNIKYIYSARLSAWLWPPSSPARVSPLERETKLIRRMDAYDIHSCGMGRRTSLLPSLVKKIRYSKLSGAPASLLPMSAEMRLLWKLLRRKPGQNVGWHVGRRGRLASEFAIADVRHRRSMAHHTTTSRGCL